jgi:ABC-type transport system involved in cytochrome c biogenesis permease subunit
MVRIALLLISTYHSSKTLFLSALVAAPIVGWLSDGVSPAKCTALAALLGVVGYTLVFIVEDPSTDTIGLFVGIVLTGISEMVCVLNFISLF